MAESATVQKSEFKKYFNTFQNERSGITDEKFKSVFESLGKLYAISISDSELYEDICESLFDQFDAQSVITEARADAKDIAPEELGRMLTDTVRKKTLATKKTEKTINPDELAEYKQLLSSTNGKNRLIFPLTLDQMKSLGKEGHDDFVLDTNKLIEMVNKEPKDIFSQNDKMAKTTKQFGNLYVYETGIPAFKGLLYDKKEQKFKVVSTCPKAGECILWCYARKGYYAMAQKPMKLTQRLNLMINYPERYKQKAVDELLKLAKKHKAFEGTDNILVIRWNDAGDFFDAYDSIYKKLAQEIITEIKNTKIGGRSIEMYSYAYTKNLEHLLDKSDAIHWTFSQGAVKSQSDKANPKEHKTSQVVPRPMFQDLFAMDKGKYVKAQDGSAVWKDGDVSRKELLKRIFDRYSIYAGSGPDNKYNIKLAGQKVPNEEPNASTIIMQADLPKQQDPMLGKYSVVVKPTGDSDIGAMRKDVRTVFLLVH